MRAFHEQVERAASMLTGKSGTMALAQVIVDFFSILDAEDLLSDVPQELPGLIVELEKVLVRMPEGDGE